MREALVDHPRGPKRAYNRLSEKREQTVVPLCERYPTWSSYQVSERLGADAPNPRTIQRVRKPQGLARVPKRRPSTAGARRIPPEVLVRVEDMVREKPHLGPERIAWDLRNGAGLDVNPSTIKRLRSAAHQALFPPPPPPVWQFYERKHLYSLWHGDFTQKVTLTDLDQEAYQLTLL
jgi:hypothetical protein